MKKIKLGIIFDEVIIIIFDPPKNSITNNQ